MREPACALNRGLSLYRLLIAIAVGLAGPACAELKTTSPKVISGSVSTAELVEARGLSGLAVSLDGASVAIQVDHQDISGNRTVLDWWIVRLSDGHATRVADGGEPRWNVNGFVALETPQWSPDGEWLYFRRLANQEVQLWRASRDGAREEQITDDTSDVEAFIVSTDGAVIYAVGPGTRDEIKRKEALEIDAGVLLDQTIIKGFPIVHGFPVNGRMATLRLFPDAANFGRSTLLGDTPLRSWRIDPRTGAIGPANDADAERLAQLWLESSGASQRLDPLDAGRAISRQHGRARVVSATTAPPGSDTASASGKTLAWQDRDGPSRQCEALVCPGADDISVVGWTSDDRRLIFQTRTFDTVRLNSWDVLTNIVETLDESPGVLGSDESGTTGTCQLAGAEAICISASADAPPRVVAIDLKSGKRRSLFEPNPDLSPDRLGSATAITLTDRFGNTTVGRLILPKDVPPGRRLPLVITSYRCDGFLLGGSGRDVPEHVLAGLGHAAVCVDLTYDVVRRAANFEVTQDSVNTSAVDFFEDAVRVLDRQGLVDPKRVALNGFSGGTTAVTFAITQSLKFTTAGVTTEGSLDPITCYVTSPARTCASLAQRQGFKRPYDDRAGILRNSPALNVEQIRTPLLMQLPEVEYVTMLQLYSAMQDYGRAVEMHVFPAAYHYKNQPRQRLSVYNRNVDWINFWLLGRESSELDRNDQNARWRELRDRQCLLFPAGGADARPWYC
ncbi:MAG: Atxe2 family lasso peptide isopeptidase [Hyphomonadaceae bacterium]|nr:Atxe2 family lasso peptide isopeptidase [Hyphomonadaceae bacterium]